MTLSWAPSDLLFTIVPGQLKMEKEMKLIPSLPSVSWCVCVCERRNIRCQCHFWKDKGFSFAFLLPAAPLVQDFIIKGWFTIYFFKVFHVLKFWKFYMEKLCLFNYKIIRSKPPTIYFTTLIPFCCHFSKHKIVQIVPFCFGACSFQLCYCYCESSGFSLQSAPRRVILRLSLSLGLREKAQRANVQWILR